MDVSTISEITHDDDADSVSNTCSCPSQKLSLSCDLSAATGNVPDIMRDDRFYSRLPPKKAGERLRTKLAERWRTRKQDEWTIHTRNSVDDGYSWRKYGEKYMLGAKYPRGYYRCNLQRLYGCPARKVVQRSNEEPAVFEIRYSGRHTCDHHVEASNPARTSPKCQEQHFLFPPNNMHEFELDPNVG